MLDFCLQSLVREYGWQFVRRVALRHPVRTARALLDAGGLDCSNGVVATPGALPTPISGSARPVVGVGFCLKPMDPPCPSGRFNHDCLYLERLMQSRPGEMPECCRGCAIREIGTMALKAGSGFYIMTSARDILFDVFAPALEAGRFRTGMFVLCRYSLKPFAAGLLASGVQGWLFPFEEGDCRDYAMWLAADRGIKNERTLIHGQTWKRIRELLSSAPQDTNNGSKVNRQDNILYPG